MKANKFSGTGGLQHWLCASDTVVKPCSSSPLLSLLLVAPGRGTLLPENPTLGPRNLPLLCSKISQRQQTPSPLFPQDQGSCPVSDYTSTKGGPAEQAKEAPVQTHRPRSSHALRARYSHLSRSFLFCTALELCLLSFTVQNP